MIPLLLAAAVSAAEPPRAVAVPEEPAAPAAPVPVLPPATARTPGMDRATSRTEQFRVSGADGLVRGTVAVMAEEAKTELLALTGEKDEWKVPVSIYLNGQQGDPWDAHADMLLATVGALLAWPLARRERRERVMA